MSGIQYVQARKGGWAGRHGFSRYNWGRGRRRERVGEEEGSRERKRKKMEGRWNETTRNRIRRAEEEERAGGGEKLRTR
eukprot:750163-Hanusia_phi.AAC.1